MPNNPDESNSATALQEFRLVSEALRAEDMDAYLYSGGIATETCKDLCRSICGRSRASKALLFLNTNGGDPHAAYVLGKTLRLCYSHLSIVVEGPCKSAGTLIALAADRLAIGCLGELGPLDIQLAKNDEIFVRESGLNTLQAVDEVQQGVFNTFIHCFVEGSVQLGRVGLTTKTLSDLAQRLAVETWKPIAQQIDPYRLAEIRRSMNIARQYGELLQDRDRTNLKPQTLTKLIERYPDHSSVILKVEAEELFNKVEELSDTEKRLAALFADELSTAIRPPQALNLRELVEGIASIPHSTTVGTDHADPPT